MTTLIIRIVLILGILWAIAPVPITAEQHAFCGLVTVLLTALVMSTYDEEDATKSEKPEEPN